MSKIFTMRRHVGVALVFLTTLLSVACNTSVAEVIVDKCGTEAGLQQGDVLVIRLESQMTAGYLWSHKSIKDGVLNEVGEAQIERTPSDLDGGSETQVFRFKASSPGKTKLEFLYQHPWQTDKPPLKKCAFSVTVKKDS